MIKMRRQWPDNWRRGPKLAARVKTKRWGERVVFGAAFASLAYAIALQFTGGPAPDTRVDAPSAVVETLAAAAPSVSSASASAASPEEQKLWDRAVLSRSRQSIEAYQKAFPAGLYAAKAQQALAACRQQTRERWQPNAQGGAMLSARGEAAMLEGMDQGQACGAARLAARHTAEQSCASNTAGAQGATARNSVIVTGEAPCACAPSADGATLCAAELQTSCRWEEKVTRIVEVCGG